VLVDLETHRILEILFSRDTKDVEEALKRIKGVEVVTRDGSKSYAQAITRTFPMARQVNDRFHLVHGLIESVRAFLYKRFAAQIDLPEEAFSKRTAEKKDTSPPFAPSPKDEVLRQVKQAFSQGRNKQQISRELHLSWTTVDRYLKRSEPWTHASRGVNRPSLVDPYWPTIIRMAKQGKKGTAILEQIRLEGYAGGISILRDAVSKWRKERRKAWGKGKANCIRFPRAQLIRGIAYGMHKVTQANKEHVQRFLQRNPQLQQLAQVLTQFRQLLEEKEEQGLTPWLEKAKALQVAEVTSFVKGIERDRVSVENAIASPFSNGMVEGFVNKIKMVKRMMFGRASFDLLRRKVLLWDFNY